MNANPFTLYGKLILVTGASSGIGRSIAIECSKMQATLIIVGRNKERLKQTFSQLAGDGHMEVEIDLNNLNKVNDFISEIKNLDGIVHCAGIIKTCPTKFIKRGDLNEIFNTNLFAPIELTQLILEKKKLNKGASVVCISSVAGGIVANKGNALYSASKGAINAYSKVLALELSSRKIRVNTILPGMINTELLKNCTVEKEEFDADELKYPLGYGEPSDIAYATIYLLSDAARWMTGTNIIIDGGLTLQ